MNAQHTILNKPYVKRVQHNMSAPIAECCSISHIVRRSFGRYHFLILTTLSFFFPFKSTAANVRSSHLSRKSNRCTGDQTDAQPSYRPLYVIIVQASDCEIKDKPRHHTWNRYNSIRDVFVVVDRFEYDAHYYDINGSIGEDAIRWFWDDAITKVKIRNLRTVIGVSNR